MSTINKNNIFITNHVYINECNNKNSIFITKHVYILTHNNHYFTCSKSKIGNFKPYARRCHYALTKVCSCTPHRMKFLMFSIHFNNYTRDNVVSNIFVETTI